MTAIALASAALASAVADRVALTRAVEIAEEIVERRNTYPILANVRLRGDGNMLFVTSTDLDIVIDVAVPAPADERFDVTVPALMLKQLLKGAPKAEYVAFTMPPSKAVERVTRWKFDIEKGENVPDATETIITFDGAVDVDFATATYQMAALPSEGFPALKPGEFTHRFSLSGIELFDSLDAVEFAVSNEETRYYLNGVYMHVVTPSGRNRPELRCTATDGHRMARSEITAPDGAIGMPGIIIPKKTVALLVKLMKGKARPETVEIEVHERFMRLHWDGVTVTSKMIDGTFPDYERVTPKNNDKAVTFKAADALAAIKAAGLVASERGGKAVKLSFEGGKLTLICNNPDMGSSAVPLAIVPGEQMPESFEIGFNARYLTDLVTEARSDEVTMLFNDAGSPTVVTGEGREGWLAVLMPMRV